MRSFDPKGDNDPSDWEADFEAWQAREDAAERAQKQATTDLTDATTRRQSLGGWMSVVSEALSQTDAQQNRLHELDSDLADVGTLLATADATLADREEARDTATARILNGPATSAPLTLLPVALHTSWADQRLRVRVLPDQLGLHAHDPRLSDGEQQAAASYWATRNAASIDQAWVELVRRVGAPRAAWVVHATTPGSPTPETNPAAWGALRIRAELLPDRFAVVAYASGEPINMAPAGAAPHYVHWTTPVQPDLSIAAWQDATGDWTSDFDLAVQAGMGLTIEVPLEAPPIDQLVAVGLRTTEASLVDLFDAHAYSSGFEVLDAGTATNNTDRTRSAGGPAHDAEVARRLTEPTSDLGPETAGGQLAELLGLDAARLGRVQGASAPRGPQNSALRLLVGLGASGSVAARMPASGIAGWPSVEPIGPAPALRVGSQPYGVLPATAPGRWQVVGGEKEADGAALKVWARDHRAAVDTDPADPSLQSPTPRHVKVDDESDLLALLLEDATTLAWTSDGPSYTGLDQLVGPVDGPGSAAQCLVALADAAPINVAAVLAVQPAQLLAQVAGAAKQAAAADPALLADVDAALRLLAAATTEISRVDLTAAFGAFLDTWSHRLDAWVVGAITVRLRAQRKLTPTPVTGAYGLLTEVAPRPANERRSYGHVHAPSLGQAATAAVLRSGYVGQLRAAEAGGSAAPPERVWEINLSSRRVRAARRVLSAVRAGQPLGAVLGYSFERGLVDAGLSTLLTAFRKLTRFHTGSALEAAEDARHEAEQALATADDTRVQLIAAAATLEGPRAAAAVAASNAQQAVAQATGVASGYDTASEQQRVQAEINNFQDQLDVDPPRPTTTRIPIGKPSGPAQLDLLDRLEAPVAQRWGAQQADLQWQLRQKRAQLARLKDLQGSPLAAAARAALSEANRIASLAAGASESADAAWHDAVDAATRYEANEVANARQLRDDALKAEADLLASLLADATTTTALTATVDGLALRERYRSARASEPPTWSLATVPFRATPDAAVLDEEITLPVIGTDEASRLVGVLDQLDELVDAIADLVTAEGVHQLVNGNPTRAGAALEIAASGSVPDELEVTRTPLSGYDLTHRVLAIAPLDLAPSWSSTDRGAASTADPFLSAWASHLLPDPAQVHVIATRVDPDTGGAAEQVDVTADRLGLGPLDWVRLSAEPGERLARVAALARADWALTIGPRAADGRVQLTNPPPGAAPYALSDLLAAATAVRTVLSSARALTAADLAPLGTDLPPSAVEAAAAVDRVTALEAYVDQLLADLGRAATAPTPTTAELTTLLLRATAVGVAEALPPLDQGVPAAAALQAQVVLAHSRLTARGAGDPINADDPRETLTWARARAATLCGFPLPLLVPVDVPSDPQIVADLKGSVVRIPGSEPAAMRSWLVDHARVRTACDSLLAAYDLAETLGAAAVLDLRASHLPPTGTVAADVNHWAADSATPPHGLVAAVLVRSAPVPGPQATGLALDAWVQTLPDSELHTGLAFHLDRPTATAPQSILVAVAPDPRPERQPATWDLDSLLEVVTSTAALAVDRAVTAEAWPSAALTVRDLG